jgi:hypothetical protein
MRIGLVSAMSFVVRAFKLLRAAHELLSSVLATPRSTANIQHSTLHTQHDQVPRLTYKTGSRLTTAVVIAAALIPSILAQAGSPSHLLNEDAALDVLQRTLKRDRVYEKRISMDCIAYGTEEKTTVYFEFVLRETHNAKCGGDPETSPAIDRYRVDRASGKIEQWEPGQDTWHPYKGQQSK